MEPFGPCGDGGDHPLGDDRSKQHYKAQRSDCRKALAFRAEMRNPNAIQGPSWLKEGKRKRSGLGRRLPVLSGDFWGGKAGELDGWSCVGSNNRCAYGMERIPCAMNTGGRFSLPVGPMGRPREGRRAPHGTHNRLVGPVRGDPTALHLCSHMSPLRVVRVFPWAVSTQHPLSPLS